MKNQVNYKAAQKAIAASGDKNQLTPEQQARLQSKLSRKKAIL